LLNLTRARMRLRSAPHRRKAKGTDPIVGERDGSERQRLLAGKMIARVSTLPRHLGPHLKLAAWA